MKKISVIVPVYNVEKYLSDCIESICNQTYTNLEIILVDDGSTDTSGSLCNSMAEKDNRIKVIHQNNGGLSAARNAGTAVATGEYISYIDSDDYIELTLYEDMVKLLEENNLDIISFNAFRTKGVKIKGKPGDGFLQIMRGEEALRRALLDENCSAWNKLYKADIAKGVTFPVGRKFEDSATGYLFMALSNKVGHTNKAYYYYRVNLESITQMSFDPKSRWDFVLGYIERLDYAKEHNIDCIDECKSLLLKAILSCLTAVYANPMTEQNKEIYNKCKNLILEYRNSHTYGLLNGKYKVFLWAFNRLDIIHIIGAKLSLATKSFKGNIQ